MTQNTLTVVAEMQAKPGKEADLRRTVMALVEPTRKEKDCIDYFLHESTSQGGRFVFYENWTSAEALDRHVQSPHFQAFQRAAESLLAEAPRIATYSRIA